MEKRSLLKTIFTADISAEIRKPLSELTLERLRARLAPVLKMINQLAEKEEVDAKTIAAYTLQLTSNESKDESTTNVCKEIITKGKIAEDS